MCGFFGVIQGTQRVPDEALQRAAARVAWRGLDEQGAFQGEFCFLAHYRLSIIDLQTGAQPMTDVTGRYVIAFNGELYNYKELREDLRAAGHEFATASDTEVFLTGLAAQGAEFLHKAEGMFAAALWDRKEKALTLARDPLGKKPLFAWNMPGGGLAFGSSPAAFRDLPGWPGDLDSAAMLLFLHCGCIPAPLCIYRGCEKIEPGTVRTHWARGAAVDTRRYAALQFGRSRTAVTRDSIQHDLRRALEIRTRADVPLALTFSGGVDSGLLACLCRDIGYDMRLFNIDYESGAQKSLERANARRAAGILGLELIEENFVPDRIFSNLPDAYRHYDEPCDMLPLVYLYDILKTIRKHGVRVAITGNGADEIFFGYRGDERVRLRSGLLRLALNAAPAAVLPRSLKTLKRDGWPAFLMEKERAALAALMSALGVQGQELAAACAPFLWGLSDAAQRASFRRYSDYHMWRNLFIGTVASNYLLPDISGMHAQVEVRAPFLDWGLIRAVADMPDKMRIGSLFTHRHNKAVLKALYAARVGPQLAYDEKRGMGWNIRFDLWIRQEPVKSLMRNAMQGLSDFGFDPSWALGHYDAYCNGAAASGDQVMRAFMLFVWLKRETEGQDALQAWLEPVRNFAPGGAAHG